ncbi:MAG TPA: iron transporter [Patescibacteria group bacterium]
MNNNEKNLAAAQGKTYDLALDEIRQQLSAVSKESGDFVITLVAGPAEGRYMALLEGGLEWKDASQQDDTQHIQIIVQDKDDHRFVPNLEIVIQVFDKDKRLVAEGNQPFLWHPYLYHYGKNYFIPEDGTYAVRVIIKSPHFPRHDRKLGNRYQQDVSVDFDSVRMIPGIKEENSS